MGQFAELKGSSWRVFAVDTYPTGPITVDRVEEVKQQHGGRPTKDKRAS